MPETYKLVTGTVEAIQITPASVQLAAAWCGGLVIDEIDPLEDTHFYAGVNVPTLEGVQRASSMRGDWIVKNGSFKVMSDQEFRNAHERI